MLHYRNKPMLAIASEFLDRSIYEKLRAISVLDRWDNDIHQGYFIIPVDKIEEAEKLLGRKIEVEEADVRAIISCCQPLKKELESSTLKKGKGEISVIEKEDVFVVIHYDKGHEQKSEVPRSLVKTAWETIKKYKKDEYVRSETVAKNILKALDIREFNTGEDKSNFDRFNFRMFIGHRDKTGTGKGYFTYLYQPLKAMQSLHLLKHFQGGTIRRIADDYDFDQAHIGVKTIVVKDNKKEDQKLIGWKPKKKTK